MISFIVYYLYSEQWTGKNFWVFKKEKKHKTVFHFENNYTRKFVRDKGQIPGVRRTKINVTSTR